MNKNKYLLSLIVATLFLSNFSTFAMQRYEEGDSKTIHDLPEDVIIYGILPFLDHTPLDHRSLKDIIYSNRPLIAKEYMTRLKKTPDENKLNLWNCSYRTHTTKEKINRISPLRNIRSTSRFLKDCVNTFICFTSEKELENGIFEELFRSPLNEKKIKQLVIELESEIKKERNIFGYKHANSNLEFLELTKKDVKEELYNFFKKHDPKIIKSLDKIMTLIKKVSHPLKSPYPLKLIQTISEKLRLLLNRMLRLNIGRPNMIYIPLVLSLTLFGICPILLGKVFGHTALGLLLCFLLAHNMSTVTFEKSDFMDYAEHPFYNHPFSKTLRTYNNIPTYIRNTIKSYIDNEKKLEHTIYGEQELHEKKNQ